MLFRSHDSMSVFYNVTDFNFCSESNRPNENILYRNVILIDLIRFYDFDADPKFNMSTKANNDT